MANPTLADAVAAILNAKGDILALIDKLEAISPDVLKGPEDAIKAAVAAVPLPNADDLNAALSAVLDVVSKGGPVGGGADANLA